MSYLHDGVIAVVIGVPCAVVGWVVARRQPANPLGWLFLVIAVCLLLSTEGGTMPRCGISSAALSRSACWDWSCMRCGAPAW
ncbi:MAG: hypothetical protein ACRDOU_14795 [Streptosporangiaceae bacterium]